MPISPLPQANTTATLPLQVLTLNCWGLKFVSKNRPGRMRAIGRALTTTTAEIIALQEVWVEEDYQVLRTLVSSRLPYTHRFLSGILGGGLVLLSKYPIIESEFRPYSLGGCPSRFYHGDWFVGKGIGRCRVLHPELGPLDILNTHFHAEYGKKYPYAAERAAQAWEVGKALRACTATTIMMGDFNLVQDSLPYQIIRALVPARDAWVSKRPQALEETSANSLLEPWERARALGVTCDAPDNTWTDGDKDGLGERLDYIWIRDESVGIKEVSVVFTERVLSLNCSFSDHFAVEATLEMTPGRMLPGPIMDLPPKAADAPIRELRDALLQHQYEVESLQQRWYLFALLALVVWAGMVVCGGVVRTRGLGSLWVVLGGVALLVAEVFLWFGLLWAGKEGHVARSMMEDVDVYLARP